MVAGAETIRQIRQYRGTDSPAERGNRALDVLARAHIVDGASAGFHQTIKQVGVHIVAHTERKHSLAVS